MFKVISLSMAKLGINLMKNIECVGVKNMLGYNSTFV